MTRTRRQLLQGEASLAAQRELERLGSSDDRPLPIFDVIEDAGVWLMFQPLGDLYGVYRRVDSAAGIAVHSGHPLGLQRFTAAHEYGHHVLGHVLSLDSADEIEAGRPRSDKELAAQAFAATFLMPVQRVNRALKGLGFGLKPTDLTAESAYQLSLELGASYRATVTQLQALNKISRSAAERLRKFQPIDIKTTLAGGRRPQNPRADVWVIDERADGRSVYAHPEDEVHIRLPESPTSGYRWSIDAGANERTVDVVEDALETPQDETAKRRYGSTHRRHLWLRFDQAGSADLTLRLARPWEGAEIEPTALFRAHFAVDPRPTGDVEHGLSQDQRPLLLQAA